MRPVLKSNSSWSDEVLYYKGVCKNWDTRYYYEESPLHPYRVNSKWVLRSRRTMERYLGRFLDPDEIVHHCDHNKKNDSIENLELVSHHGHMEIHNPKQKLPFSDEEVINALKKTGYHITKAAEVLGCPPALLWGGKCNHLYEKRNSPHFLKTNYEIVCSSCRNVGISKTAKIFGTIKSTPQPKGERHEKDDRCTRVCVKGWAGYGRRRMALRTGGRNGRGGAGKPNGEGPGRGRDG